MVPPGGSEPFFGDGAPIIAHTLGMCWVGRAMGWAALAPGPQKKGAEVARRQAGPARVPQTSPEHSEFQAGRGAGKGACANPAKLSPFHSGLSGHRALGGASEAGVTPVLGRVGLGWGAGPPKERGTGCGAPRCWTNTGFALQPSSLTGPLPPPGATHQGGGQGRRRCGLLGPRVGGWPGA